MRKLLPLCCLLILINKTEKIVAQDPQFSQYFSSPLTLNPAFTGYYEGKYRLSTNFRNQWLGAGDPFTTATIGFDTRILTSKLQNNLLGVGVNLMGDRTATGTYNSNYASLSAAYHQSLDEEGNQHIGVGFQGNFGTRSLDYNRLPYNAQFSSRGFDLSLDNTENFVSRNASYYDFNLGLMYNYLRDRKRIYFGASYYHVNQPSITFLGNDFYVLPGRISVHSGASFLVGQQGEVMLSGLYMNQGGVPNTTIGVGYGYSPVEQDDNRVFYAGLYYRHKDAVYPYFGVLYNNIRIGLSYDVNTTGIQLGSKRNRSFELSLVYHFFDPAALKKMVPWY